MDRKINDVMQSVGGYEEFEQLVKRGRQMHDRAVFDLFAPLASKAAHFVKENLGIKVKRQKTKDCYREVCESVF
jgi:hypothetical protein